MLSVLFPGRSVLPKLFAPVAIHGGLTRATSTVRALDAFS